MLISASKVRALAGVVSVLLAALVLLAGCGEATTKRRARQIQAARTEPKRR